MRAGKKFVDLIHHKGKIYCFIRDIEQMTEGINDYEDLIPYLFEKYEPAFVLDNSVEATKFFILVSKVYAKLQGWERRRLINCIQQPACVNIEPKQFLKPKKPSQSEIREKIDQILKRKANKK